MNTLLVGSRQTCRCSDESWSTQTLLPRGLIRAFSTVCWQKTRLTKKQRLVFRRSRPYLPPCLQLLQRRKKMAGMVAVNPHQKMERVLLAGSELLGRKESVIDDL